MSYYLALCWYNGWYKDWEVGVRLSRTFSDAASEVKATAGHIGQAAQWNTVALVAVTTVSLAALLVATLALMAVKR
jgi:hypothetical protein